MRLLLALAFALFAASAIAAPSDDGQTAGSRTWVLNQARLFAAVTPSDSADLSTAPTRAIYTSGTSGAAACNLAVRGADNGTTAITFVNIQPGVVYPFQIQRVMASGTTCVNIIAMY